jgi:hypothetical protein
MFSHKKEDVLKHTKGNREELLASESCACLGCCSTFPAHEIREWTDDIDGVPGKAVDRTAVCPHCGEALLIGDHGEYEITDAFLEAMRRR